VNLKAKLICYVRSSEYRPDPRVRRLVSFLVKQESVPILLGLNRSGESPVGEDGGDFRIERFTFLKHHALPVDEVILGPFMVIWMFWVMTRLLRLRPDVIVASDFDTMMPCIVASKTLGRPLIHDPHDFWADDLGPPIPSFIIRSVRRMEQLSTSFASGLIIADISRIAQYDRSRLPPRVVEIVNSPMKASFLPGGKHRDLAEKGEMIVLYAGQLGTHGGILELIGAVRANSGIKLVLVGYGRIESEVSEAISRRRNGVFLGRKSHEEVLSLTRDCDVVYAMYDPDVPNNRFASPNKLFEAMACGKPVLVNDNTRLADLVRAHNCGLVIPYGDEDSIRAALSSLRDNKNLRTQLGANGLKAYEKYYNWNIMEDRLRRFFDEI